MAKAVGKRSPRWAFMAKMLIPCQNGIAYLFRIRIVQTPWFGIYLHDIYEPDGDRDPHNHPWSFVSIVLRGSYTERVHPDPGGARHGQYIEKTHKRFSIHRMGRENAHRIVIAAPGLKTLIFVGPRKAGWGFFMQGTYVPWENYEELYELKTGARTR